MGQKKITSLTIISVITLVLLLSGIWYWQNQKGKVKDIEVKNFKAKDLQVKDLVEKLPVRIDTSTWLPYVVGYIQFRYPPDWEIEENEVTLESIKQKSPLGFITQSVLAQAQKTAIEIILSPSNKQSEEDVIKIGGKAKNCKELGIGYKCKERIGVPVYTASKSYKVAQIFNNLVDTFDIYFEVADVDTGISIDDVKITAKYVPAMTSEEFRTGTYKYCFECIITERDAIIRCSNKCGTGEEKIFIDKQEFRQYLKNGPLGTYVYTVESKGYATMSSYIIKSEGLHELGNIMMMSPATVTYGQSRKDIPELREEYIRSLLKPGTVLVIGFVVDDVFLKPLEGVEVSIPKLNLVTKTNSRGFYFFNVPEYPGKIDSCKKMIETSLTYIYSKNGFKIFEKGEDYPVVLRRSDAKKPYYLILNARMLYGPGKIIHKYILPGACLSERY